MEENKKGQNTLYAVIGVATLVVAIIGATFAYFSAQATAGGEVISGETNDIGGALSLTVTKINFFGVDSEGRPDSDNLIPADFNLATANQPTTAELNGVLSAKCVDGGYTGCHLYKISAHATQALSAKLLLQNFTLNTAEDKESWKYVVFQGSDTTAEGITSSVTASTVLTETAGTFDDTDDATNNGTASPFGYEVDEFDMDAYSDDNPTENVYDYYLLIYLANKDAVQNDTDTAANYGVGSYSGNVLLDAGDGSGLVASFNG